MTLRILKIVSKHVSSARASVEKFCLLICILIIRLICILGCKSFGSLSVTVHRNMSSALWDMNLNYINDFILHTDRYFFCSNSITVESAVQDSDGE